MVLDWKSSFPRFGTILRRPGLESVFCPEIFRVDLRGLGLGLTVLSLLLQITYCVARYALHLTEPCWSPAIPPL